LALLLLHERRILFRAKANVPNERSRFLEKLSSVVYRIDVNRISYNGPVVWEVAVCVGVGM
jgi:hypothetical protein